MKRIDYFLIRIWSARRVQLSASKKTFFSQSPPGPPKKGGYGEGEVLMFTSVFSFLVSVAGDDGFITVVLLSFFCSGGFTTVVLLSFFSAGGFATVVSFCSQATSSAKPANRQMYFFIQMNRISSRNLPCWVPSRGPANKRKYGGEFLIPDCFAFVAVTAAHYEHSFRFLPGEVKSMLRWAVIFLGIALLTAVFGSSGIAEGAAAIAKLLVFLFSVMCVILFILGMAVEGRIP